MNQSFRQILRIAGVQIFFIAGILFLYFCWNTDFRLRVIPRVNYL